jgi:uncharacterized protein (UPF0335 family)
MVSSSSHGQEKLMTWEEALEAHVLENAGQFDAVAAGLADMQTFAVAQFRDTQRRLDRLEADVSELKADVAELKADVAGLKADVRSLRVELDALRSDMNTRFDRLEGQIDLLVRVLVQGRN